jgi:hypothetical protein
MRKAGVIGILLVVFLGSFFATLWFTGTGPPPSTTDPRSFAEQLASRSIFSRSDLIEAAVAIGLHSSPRMKGSGDSITRINDREVTIKGWLADPDGDATALNVLVFVAGKYMATTQTRGERPDVTKLLGLAFGAERNVAFEVSFACRTDDKPIIVSLGLDKQYLYLSSPQCP